MSLKFLEQFKVYGGKSASELVDEISRAFFQSGKSGRINIVDVTTKGFCCLLRVLPFFACYLRNRHR